MFLRLFLKCVFCQKVPIIIFLRLPISKSAEACKTALENPEAGRIPVNYAAFRARRSNKTSRAEQPLPSMTLHST